MDTSVTFRKWGCAVVAAGIFCQATSNFARASLILHYPFNEGAGTTTANATGVTGANLQLQDQNGNAAALWATGLTGKPGDYAFDNSAATLGGAGGRAIAAGDIPAADVLKSLTLSGWYYHPAGDFGAVHAYLAGDLSDSTTNDGYAAMFRSTGGVLRLDAGIAGPNSSGSAIYARTGNWVFFAVSYDGTSSSNNLNYYVGSLTEPVTLVSSATLNSGTTLDNSAPFAVGNASNTLDNAFHGYLDEIRLYGSTSDGSGALGLSALEADRVAAIPEPGTALLMTAAMVVVLRRRSPRPC